MPSWHALRESCRVSALGFEEEEVEEVMAVWRRVGLFDGMVFRSLWEPLSLFFA